MVETDVLKALGAGAVLGGLACFVALKSRKGDGAMLNVRSTTASGSVVYESARAVVGHSSLFLAIVVVAESFISLSKKCPPAPGSLPCRTSIFSSISHQKRSSRL